MSIVTTSFPFQSLLTSAKMDVIQNTYMHILSHYAQDHYINANSFTAGSATHLNLVDRGTSSLNILNVAAGIRAPGVNSFDTINLSSGFTDVGVQSAFYANNISSLAQLRVGSGAMLLGVTSLNQTNVVGFFKVASNAIFNADFGREAVSARFLVSSLIAGVGATLLMGEIEARSTYIFPQSGYLGYADIRSASNIYGTQIHAPKIKATSNLFTDLTRIAHFVTSKTIIIANGDASGAVNTILEVSTSNAFYKPVFQITTITNRSNLNGSIVVETSLGYNASSAGELWWQANALNKNSVAVMSGGSPAFIDTVAQHNVFITFYFIPCSYIPTGWSL